MAKPGERGDPGREGPDWDVWRGAGFLPGAAAGGVGLFFCETGKIAERERRLFLSWLDAGEEERRRRFLDERDAVLFAVAHGLTRYVLSLWRIGEGRPGWEVAPGDWRFAVDAAGRPAALLPAGMEKTAGTPIFSLSHTRGAVALAVAAAGKLGVDVERSRRPTEAALLAERFFAPEELADLAGCRGEKDSRKRFILYWTLKEAYLKALGVGMIKSLSSFAMSPGRDGADLLYDMDGAEGEWLFRHYHPPGGFTLSLAVGGSAFPDEPRIVRLAHRPGRGWSCW
ncbi:MAG: 4'-phosphopantetheinyl transferase superfamily protein [Planctomycetota bacterium]|jgi:4'-phosphopantetheinyl transferase|nr:4'-phosphopantetheinyl transferase superfamily protein [Planctomycetota bacterium]